MLSYLIAHIRLSPVCAAIISMLSFMCTTVGPAGRAFATGVRRIGAGCLTMGGAPKNGCADTSIPCCYCASDLPLTLMVAQVCDTCFAANLACREGLAGFAIGDD